MPSTDFSGRDIVKVLTKNNFRVTGRAGSHVRLEYQSPTNPNDVRKVSVPMHNRVKTRTLRSIATQCGANDFDAWCRWIDRQR